MVDTTNIDREKTHITPEKARESGREEEQVESGVRSGVDLGLGKEVSERIRTIEGVESAEEGEGAEVMGRVSEVESKVSDKDFGGRSAKAQQQMDPAQLKAHLLKTAPSEKVMRKQVEKEIIREIKHLRKKAVKMSRSPGEMSYFEMTNIMQRIRELKGLLTGLVKASYETLRTLWLRYVHGVM